MFQEANHTGLRNQDPLPHANAGNVPAAQVAVDTIFSHSEYLRHLRHGQHVGQLIKSWNIGPLFGQGTPSFQSFARKMHGAQFFAP